MTGGAVLLVHGAVRSGKTTAVGAAAAAGNCVGVLAPDGPDGRHFVDLASGDEEPLEHPESGEAVVEVGRFRFRRAAFDFANARLLAADGNRGVVVDEVGPLELRGEGLAPGLGALLAVRPALLILIVRDPLLATVRHQFGLGEVELWGTDTWPHLAHRLSGVR